MPMRFDLAPSGFQTRMRGANALGRNAVSQLRPDCEKGPNSENNPWGMLIIHRSREQTQRIFRF